jgi:hypothetical protein
VPAGLDEKRLSTVDPIADWLSFVHRPPAVVPFPAPSAAKKAPGCAIRRSRHRGAAYRRAREATMTVFLARVLLGAVFIAAATAKLTDRGDVRRALVGFGVPNAVAAPLGWTLLGAELGTGGLLLVEPAPKSAAWRRWSCSRDSAPRC